MARRDNENDKILNPAALENILIGAYDAFVEENARIRAKAGLTETITREAIGGCCDWCSKLAGTYRYGEEPKEIYQKHDNCTCVVTAKTDKGYTDVWSKKEYQSQKEAREARERIIMEEQGLSRKARIDRIKRVEKQEEAEKVSNRNRRQAKAEGKNCYDATEEWTGGKDGNGRVLEQNYLVIDNEKKYVDGKHILLDYTAEEKHVAQILANEFGGEISVLPRTSGGGIHKNIKSPDYLLNGMKADLKTPKGCGKNTIYDIIKSGKKQANVIVLNISETSLSEKEILRQIEECVFSSTRTKNIETIILINEKENRLLRVISRV